MCAYGARLSILRYRPSWQEWIRPPHSRWYGTPDNDSEGLLLLPLCCDVLMPGRRMAFRIGSCQCRARILFSFQYQRKCRIGKNTCKQTRKRQTSKQWNKYSGKLFICLGSSKVNANAHCSNDRHIRKSINKRKMGEISFILSFGGDKCKRFGKSNNNNCLCMWTYASTINTRSFQLAEVNRKLIISFSICARHR